MNKEHSTTVTALTKISLCNWSVHIIIGKQTKLVVISLCEGGRGWGRRGVCFSSTLNF